jgi:hypothetical protein
MTLLHSLLSVDAARIANAPYRRVTNPFLAPEDVLALRHEEGFAARRTVATFEKFPNLDFLPREPQGTVSALRHFTHFTIWRCKYGS